MTNPNQLAPMHQWQQRRVDGDWALCDPFDATEFKPAGAEYSIIPQERRSPVLEADPETSKGFGFLIGSSTRSSEYQTKIWLYLTDPSQHDGLGGDEQLCEYMDAADLVGFSTERSVLMGAQQSEAMEAQYLARLKAAAKRVGKIGVNVDLTFDFSLPRDGDGNFLTEGGQRVQQVADAVRLDMFRQADYAQPDDDFIASDMVHTAEKQQALGAEVGKHIDNLSMMYAGGEYPENVLIIPAAEFGAIANDRLMDHQDPVAANTLMYEMAIRRGAIPADWVEPDYIYREAEARQ